MAGAQERKGRWSGNLPGLLEVIDRACTKTGALRNFVERPAKRPTPSTDFLPKARLRTLGTSSREVTWKRECVDTELAHGAPSARLNYVYHWTGHGHAVART